MRLRILGAAAGGGYPQWNCGCAVCRAARDGSAQTLTQSSIAVRGDSDERWVLVNASPDLRAQLASLPFDRGDALRGSPVAAIVLTDAEIDHTAGLLLLRESSEPLHVWSTEDVRVALTDHYPVLRMLERYCGVVWHELMPGVATSIDGTSISVEPFVTGGDAPLYMGPDAADGPEAIGLTIRDAGAADAGPARSLCYAPAIADAGDAALLDRLRASDCVLADGTFWTSDELVSLGLTRRDSFAMGHAPLTGSQGTLDTLADLPAARRILVHINNSNPILLAHSDERSVVEARGVEIGHDGLEVEL